MLIWGFPGGLVVNNPPAKQEMPTKQETRAHYLVREDPLAKEVAMHSSILAWEIPWTEETYGPQRVHGVTKSQDTSWMTLQQQQQQYYLYDWLNLKRYLVLLSRKPLNQSLRLSNSRVKYSLGLDRVRLYKELPNNYFTSVWDECMLVK